MIFEWWTATRFYFIEGLSPNFTSLSKLIGFYFLPGIVTKPSFLMYSMGFRGGSRAAATSTMERFVIIANRFQPLTIITKHSILDVAATLDPPLTQSTLKHRRT